MRLRSVGVLAVPIGCGVLLYGNADPFLERPRCDSVRLAPVDSVVHSHYQRDDLPLLSVDELRTHASEESCWVCLDGVVYDVTEFSRSHPGGTEALVGAGGQDITGYWNKYRVHYGSDAALTALASCPKVGRLSEEDCARIADPTDVENIAATPAALRTCTPAAVARAKV